MHSSSVMSKTRLCLLFHELLFWGCLLTKVDFQMLGQRLDFVLIFATLEKALASCFQEDVQFGYKTKILTFSQSC